MEDRHACRVISSIFEPSESFDENFCRLSRTNISDNATHVSVLLSFHVFATMLYLRTPTSDVLLLGPADRQRPSRNIFRDRRPRANRGILAHLDRRHEFHVRSHKDPIADDRLMLLDPVVIAGNGPSADVDLFPNHRI